MVVHIEITFITVKVSPRQVLNVIFELIYSIINTVFCYFVLVNWLGYEKLVCPNIFLIVTCLFLYIFTVCNITYAYISDQHIKFVLFLMEHNNVNSTAINSNP